jgi:PAS domain S-box-containing protein
MAFRFQSKKIYWLSVSVFFLFSMAIVMLGYFFYEHQKKIIKQEKRDQVDAIADLKAQQIINWREDRIGEAKVIFENQFLLSNIHQWLENPSDSIQRGKVLTWMTSLQKYLGYEEIDLLDTKGTLRLSILERDRHTCSYTQAMTGEAIRTKKIVFIDLHRSNNNDEIHLGIAIPIFVPKGDDIIPIAVLHLLMDPYQFLYPLIQSWPTLSSTAESLLIRREGEEVLFLNELRHRKNTALTLRVPISKQQLPVAIAALGGEGIVEGIDYRGVSVLAAIRHIPDSPWSLIAEVGQEEIYAPIRQQIWFTGIVVGLLIAGSGLGLGLLLRHQRVEFYKSQYKAELERQALAQHFDYLTKYANDIILLENQDLKIIEANERALASYGYTRDELLQLNAWDLRSPETKPLFDATLKQVEEEKGLIFETMHQRKDGTTFPVEISIRIIEVEGKKFYQGIIRDITERKKAEEALKGARAFTESALNSITDIFYSFDLSGKFLSWNKTFNRISGYSEQELPSKKPIDFFLGEDIQRIAEAVERIYKEGTSKTEANFVLKDGRQIPCEFTGSILKDSKGNIIGFSGTGRDITERKRAEEEREKLIRELQKALAEVKTLSGLIPICASCKKIRDDKGYWNQIETYIRDHSEADFSHGICPECAKKLYPELYKEDIKNRKGSAG